MKYLKQNKLLLVCYLSRFFIPAVLNTAIEVKQKKNVLNSLTIVLNQYILKVSDLGLH